MTARNRPERGLARQRAFRREKRVFALFTEGKVTEPDYFNALNKDEVVRREVAVDVRIKVRGTAPKRLVEAAIEARDTLEDADFNWCVFDTEMPTPHGDLQEALALADRHGVNVALSNPCFEVWLILHHEAHQAAFGSSAAAKKKRHLLDGSTSDSVKASEYLPRRAQAATRAQALRAMHSRNQTPRLVRNPSTDVDELMAAIEGA